MVFCDTDLGWEFFERRGVFMDEEGVFGGAFYGVHVCIQSRYIVYLLS